jgi:hypothetical protein
MFPYIKLSQANELSLAYLEQKKNWLSGGRVSLVSP